MYIIPSYSMLASTATTLMLSMIFLILSYQSSKNYMRLWGISWLLCSCVFLLDFFKLNIIDIDETTYITLRQILMLCEAHLFLLGTYHFFQKKFNNYFNYTTWLSAITILLYPTIPAVYSFMLIPNIIYCSGLIIISGCMFIAISWTQKIPEKMIASFLIIIWSIFINHFGFTFKDSSLASLTYFIGLFAVNLLILILIILYFKKLRFIDKKSSSRFRILVENSSDAMFLYDYNKQQFEYITPTIYEFIGLSDKQLYNMPDRFFDYINVEEKHKNIVKIFSNPISQPGNGTIVLYSDGNIKKWSEIHYIPIKDNTGIVTAVEGILRDITERKIMEINLKDAEDAKKELLENISHEIKTPVTLIKGYTESMLDKLVPKESTDTYLKMINSKAMMLSTLMDDLAQISEVTSQSMEYKFYEQSAASLFEEMVNQCRFQIESQEHTANIYMHVSHDAVVIADPYRIQQVVSNIINNALRHTPAGKEISVSCSSYFHEELLSNKNLDDYDIPKGDIVFTVSDTGDGIPEKDLPHIFERNFSGGNRVRKDGAKTGLGLYISNQIVTQHSGRMTARNNPSGGAEVSFMIPYYK